MSIKTILVSARWNLPYDAHYFPDRNILFTRISEPKNYSASKEPPGITGLCVEIPCTFGDHIWEASDEEIHRLVVNDLDHAGLPILFPIKASFVRRIQNVYPVYNINFEQPIRTIENYLNRISGLITLGRQGLFAHDNTHHTLEMAYKASNCFQPGPMWDSQKWQLHREEFSKHVVED